MPSATARDPQLDMELGNMPGSLNVDLVEEYMRPILEAACGGRLEKMRAI